MLTSAVSSEMLAAIGKSEGFDVEETLTGFKWIGNRALQLGDQAIYGYGTYGRAQSYEIQCYSNCTYFEISCSILETLLSDLLEFPLCTK